MIMLISHVESQRWPFNNTQLTKKCTLSVRTKKNNNNETTISSTHHPSAWGNSLSVVEFLPGFLSHIIFNIFFPKNFPTMVPLLYLYHNIRSIDTILFNVFAIFNLVSWQISSLHEGYKKKCFSGNSITTSLSWNSSFVRKEHKERFLRPKIESTSYYFFSSTVGVMRHA